MSKRSIPYIVGLVALLFASLVWPTPYRYDKIESPSLTLPIRVNRLTGKVEVLLSNGTTESASTSLGEATASSELSPEELKLLKLSWKPKASQPGRYAVTVYNGSDHTLTDVVVEVAANPPNSTKDNLDGLPNWVVDGVRSQQRVPPELALPRKYRLNKDGLAPAEALQASEWALNLGFDAEGQAPLAIHPVNATSMTR